MVKRIIKWCKSKSTLSNKMLIANNGSLVSFVLFVIAHISIITATILRNAPDIIFYVFIVIYIISILLSCILDLISA